MFCRKCGTQLPEGSEYCEKCGTKLSNYASVKQGQTQEKSEDTPLLSKKQLYLIAGSGAISYVSHMPAWYMNIINIAITLTAWNFAKKAFNEKKWIKLSAIIIVFFVAFAISSVAMKALSTK